MATYYTLGLEPYKMAEVYGIHSNKKVALNQAESLENNKNKMSCQDFKVLTETQVKKEKWELFN